MMLLTAVLSALMAFGALQASTSTQPTGPLQGAAVLTGRVLDPSGQPMRDMGVTAFSKRLASNGRPVPSPVPGQPMFVPFGRARTNALGEFRVNVPAGEYLLAAESPSDFRSAAYAPGFVALPTFFPDTIDASHAQPVAVRDGETASDLVIRMVSAPAFQLSGIVVDEMGAPFINVLVSLNGAPAGTNPMLGTVTGGMSAADSAARFSFGVVPAGVYTLLAAERRSGMGTRIEMELGADGIFRARPQPGSVEVTITNANVDNVRIVLPRPR